MHIPNIKNHWLQFWTFVTTRRVFYTIYFNFRYLPFCQAKHLPIHFFPHAYADVEKGAQIVIGDAILNSKYKRVLIGEDLKDFGHQCEKTYLHLAGTISFAGLTRILRGCLIDVCGTLCMGNNVVLCANTKLRCYNQILIYDEVTLSHESQIFDTNFHYIVDVEKPEFRPMSHPIKIGSYVWIGNRSTVNAGAVIPDNTIVASNSLVNKDLSDIPAYSIVAGTPCKVVKSGVRRVWDMAEENKYKKQEFAWCE